MKIDPSDSGGTGGDPGCARAPPPDPAPPNFEPPTRYAKGKDTMKKPIMTVAVMAIVVLVSLPCVAQDTSDKGGGGCAIEGTWYGSNSAALNFIFRVEKNAAGGYSVVADGFSDPDIVTYCLESTAWHGELVKTGPQTFLFRQLELCDPDPAFFGPIPGLLFWAAEGEFAMVSCDRIEAVMPIVGAYFWGNGKVPFIDPFDIPFPEVTGTFERMPQP